MVTTSQPPLPSARRRSNKCRLSPSADAARKRAERRWLRDTLGNREFQLAVSREQRRRRYANVACLLESLDGKVFTYGTDGLHRVTLGPAQLRASGLRLGTVPFELWFAMSREGAVREALCHRPLPPLNSMAFRAHALALYIHTWVRLRSNKSDPPQLRRYLDSVKRGLNLFADTALDNPLGFLSGLAIFGWAYQPDRLRLLEELARLGCGVFMQLLEIPGVASYRVPPGRTRSGDGGFIVEVPVPGRKQPFCFGVPDRRWGSDGNEL